MVSDCFGDHGGQCDADDHRQQLENLTQGISLGALFFGGEELWEERTVVGIDKRIKRSGQHIGDKRIPE